MAAVLVTAPCYAGWLKLGVSTDGNAHYLDVDTLRKSGPLRVTIWARQEYSKPTFGTEFKSRKVLLEHDCLLNRQRFLQSISYTGKNLTGYSEMEKGMSDWIVVEQDTLGNTIGNLICRYVR